MLKDTMKTRRSMVMDGYLTQMQSPDGDMPAGMTAGLLEKAAQAVGSYHDRYIAENVHRSWRMHTAVTRRERPIGHEEAFIVFLDDGDDMIPIQAKAIFGRGDYGEAVLTFADPGETVVFSGTVSRIRADYILYLANFMGKEGEHSYRIEVTPHPSGGALLCATSGACMGLFLDRNAFCEKPFFLTPSKKMLSECKAKYNESRRYVILDGDRVTVENDRDSIQYIEPGTPVSEHSDVRWQDIVTRALSAAVESPILNAPVNSAELGRFFVNIPGGSAALRLYSPGSEDVIVVRLSGLPEFLGLVAPVRVNGFGPVWPDWLDHLRPDFPVDDFMARWTEAQQAPDAIRQ